MKHNFLKINQKDNVFVALTDIIKGEIFTIDDSEFHITKTILAKHKFAAVSLEIGTSIYMYGLVVGKASKKIEKGEALTTENVLHQTEKFGKRIPDLDWSLPNTDTYKVKTFNGYHREDGQVGTLNTWLVVPLVFCENRNIEVLKEAFLEELGFAKTNPYKKYVRSLINQNNKNGFEESYVTTNEETDNRIFKNIDGLKFLTHQGGCGGIRQDSDMLCGLIAGYINNPNVAGATILSLGCQNAQASILYEKLSKLNPNHSKPVFIVDQQKEGAAHDLMLKAIQQTFSGLLEANKIERKPASLSHLTIGLECGGSDGFSGISANPAVGYASDLIVALGGKTILAEFPELCGVEQNLINRCQSDEMAEKFSGLMYDYEKSVIAVGSGFDMNPSPGNIKDGLITDAMKSAGAAKKGGNSPIVDVLDYTEYATKSGLNLLCTPGNDAECTTALAGSGANVILFTTGLGTPMGNPITPVVKISSNTILSERMSDIIDINTGTIISGEKSIEQMGEEILDFIIEIASGNIKTKAMQLEQNDFIPWKRGVSL